MFVFLHTELSEGEISVAELTDSSETCSEDIVTMSAEHSSSVYVTVSLPCLLAVI